MRAARKGLAIILSERTNVLIGRISDMILLERYCESIGEDHTIAPKHERKTLGHAVMFLMVILASPAISKDFGILIPLP
jgi:hypothetical protein